MKQEETQKMLEGLRNYVIQQSRSNLTRLRKNTTKTLYGSIKGDVQAHPNSIRLSFSMENYGWYQDQGVKGKTSGNKAPNSPFRFGTGTGKKGGLTKGINKWVRMRGIKFRDQKTGRKLTYQSTAFLITRSIYHKGMKPSLFFTKPFQAALDRLPDDFMQAYALDMQKLLNGIMKENFKNNGK
jgi:hypothetical protein